MKKLIFSLFLASVMVVTAFAQEESEHLTFKGVPINGTLSEYVAKMKQAGFTYVDTRDGMAMLQGEFAGFKGCIVGVNTFKPHNKVNAVAVIFPEQDNWGDLESDYNHLKSMLTEKYGEPSECVEEFQGYGEPETNNEKFYKLRINECTWYTTFSTPKGKIQLSIDNQGVMGSCYVNLRYFDKINSEAVRAQAMEDL